MILWTVLPEQKLFQGLRLQSVSDVWTPALGRTQSGETTIRDVNLTTKSGRNPEIVIEAVEKSRANAKESARKRNSGRGAGLRKVTKWRSLFEASCQAYYDTPVVLQRYLRYYDIFPQYKIDIFHANLRAQA